MGKGHYGHKAFLSAASREDTMAQLQAPDASTSGC